MKVIKCHICGRENTYKNTYCSDCNHRIKPVSLSEDEYCKRRGGKFLYREPADHCTLDAIFHTDRVDFLNYLKKISGHLILPVTLLIDSLINRFCVGYRMEPQEKWLAMFGLTGPASMYIVDLSDKILGHSILPVTVFVTSLIYGFVPYRTEETAGGLMRDVNIKIYKEPSFMDKSGENKCVYEKYWDTFPMYCKKNAEELLLHLGPYDFPELSAGQYTMEISDPFSKNSLSFRLSDIELVSIQSDMNVLFMACNTYTGELLADVDFFLYGEKKVSPDKDGIVNMYWSDIEPDSSVTMLACRGDSEAKLDISRYRQKKEDFKSYIYTDRPVYRPGHSVNFKSILRTGKTLEYTEGETINISIKNSKYEKIYNKILKTDEYGTISDNFKLSDTCSQGTYSINVKRSDYYSDTAYFCVSEYRKPEFYINITTDRPFYITGDKITVTAEGYYYLGRPLADGELCYKVENRYSTECEGQTRTDSYGKAQFSWIVPDRRLFWNYSYKVHVKLHDDSGREVEQYKEIPVYPFPFMLSLSVDKIEYGPGEVSIYIQKGAIVPVKIIAEDYSGKAVETEVLFRIKNDLSEEVARKMLTTDKDGFACYEYSFNKTGFYELQCFSAKNVNIKTSLPVYCYFREDYTESIKIITDKTCVEPGDSLYVMVIFPPSSVGNAVVTIERKGITSEIIDFSKKKFQEFYLHIDEYYRDGFTIGVYYSSSEGVKFIGKRIGYNSKDKYLTVSVKNDKEKYLPREYAQFFIKTSHSNGKPASSQVTMSIIDSSIYGINKEKRQSIEEFFLKSSQSRYISRNVNMSCSKRFERRDYYREVIKTIMNFLHWEIKYNIHEYDESKMSEESVTSLKQPDFTRENFLDTVYFNPNIITDHNGIAEVTVPMPDNLTTWKATLLGVTKDTMVGETGKNITVTKKLFVRIITPRFFRERDEVAISGIIHNYLSSDKNVCGRCITDGAIEILNRSDYKVNVGSGNTATVIWNIKVIREGSCSIKISALTDEESDEVKITLPILPHGCEKTISISNTTDNEREEVFTLPEEGITSPLCLITLESSIASSILSSIEYLVSFTYGCMEQTMNRFLPNVIVSKAFEELDLAEAATEDRVILSEEEADGEEDVENEIEKGVSFFIELGRGLLELVSYFDVSPIIKRVKSLRKRMVLEHGILIPPVKVKDNLQLESDTYSFVIGDRQVAAGELRVRKFLAAGTEYQVKKFKGTETTVPNYSLAGVWINQEQILDAQEEGCIILEPLDVIEAHLAEVIKKYASNFITFQKKEEAFKITGNKYKKVKDLPQMVRVGLERLYNYRNYDGGWSWWPYSNGQSQPFVTGYVLYGMALAKDAGYSVSKSYIDSAVKCIKKHYEKEDNLNAKAFMAFACVAAGEYKESWLTELLDKRDELDNYSRAILSISLKKINFWRKDIDKLTALIEESAEITGDMAWWSSKADKYGWTDSIIETTAYCLKALIATKKDSHLIQKAVRFLSKNRKGNKWNSTKDTAAVLMALTDYMKTTGEINANFKAEVSLNDHKPDNLRFKQEDTGKEGKKIRYREGLNPGKNSIKFKLHGHGTLYYSLYTTYYTKEEAIKGSDSGFTVTRNYFICDKNNSPVIPYRDPPFIHVNLFDEIMVQLKIKGRPVYEYVIIEDPKPAGCEILEKKGYLYRWGDEGVHGEKEFEARDDRAAFFFSYWQDGICEITYYMKVEAMGIFHVMPARASLMYSPEVNGISDETIIKTPFYYTGKVKEVFKRMLSGS